MTLYTVSRKETEPLLHIYGIIKRKVPYEVRLAPTSPIIIVVVVVVVVIIIIIIIIVKLTWKGRCKADGVSALDSY